MSNNEGMDTDSLSLDYWGVVRRSNWLNVRIRDRLSDGTGRVHGSNYSESHSRFDITHWEPDMNDPIHDIAESHERELQRAYKLGLLHGINAQSMAQAKNNVLAFEDYGWDLDE